jgi:hypothetical protein
MSQQPTGDGGGSGCDGSRRGGDPLEELPGLISNTDIEIGYLVRRGHYKLFL